ncbi:MAG TPA: ATP-binding protein, partial [Ktedonobacteraceae bacterium]|nr:ATP-binding protein [Ktedonobacteraceae bacterium]
LFRLKTRLQVQGNAEISTDNRHEIRKHGQIGAALFRIVQEALTNAYKHANATEIAVRLSYLPRAIEVEIRDNGQGLQGTLAHSDPSNEKARQRIYSGHGLHSMRERAEELGGTLEIISSPNAGVTVEVNIPVV